VKPDPPRHDTTEQATSVTPKRQIPLILRAMLGGAAIVWIASACWFAITWLTMGSVAGQDVTTTPWPWVVGGITMVASILAVMGGLALGVIGVCVGILAWIVRGRAR
jgi:hypothetical protein